MSYLVLARKWRPQTFADLVGQEHVAQTLRNAIAQGRIAHSFLFTGARGVGKTTIARVLAKSLNCLSAPGPTAEPCAKCAACEEIARGNDVDVKEIDGASNNSVDDVRRLQESLPYLPARDRFKVVIIDEVHMLSTGAFNALLKTLEEPPPHVKFIFATTEVHKVPITILSRCQRYDFKLIPTQKIRDRVEFILQNEKVAHDEAAVTLVAREAAGSMRDALSLLDQVIAGSSGTVTGVEASRLLGVAARSVLYHLVQSVLRGDAPAALQTIEEITREGYDLSAFARDFLAVLRDLVVAKVVAEPGDLLDLADEERADVIKIAATAERADLDRLFVAWLRTTEETREAREPRWVLEMALVRLANRPPLLPIDDLLSRLSDMERRLGGGGGGDTRGPAPSGSGPSGGTTRGASSSGAAVSSSGTASAPATSSSPVSVPRAQASVESNVALDRSAANTAPRDSIPVGAVSTSAAPAWLARVQARASQPPPPPTPVNTNAPMAPPRSVPPPADRIDVSMAAKLIPAWARVLEGIESGPVAVLKQGIPLEISADVIRLGFESGSFYARKVATAEVHEIIAAAAKRAFGSSPKIEIVQGSIPDDAPSIARQDETKRLEMRAARESDARKHPLVTSFLALVGGEVRSVKFDGELS